MFEMNMPVLVSRCLASADATLQSNPRKSFRGSGNAAVRRRRAGGSSENIELVEFDSTRLVHGSQRDPSQLLLIERTMPAEEVTNYLIQHGCPDITSRIDLTRCAHKPFARGGYGAIYTGALVDGQRVAIKVIDALVYRESQEWRWKVTKKAAKELYSWSKSNHPGVLQLLGLAWFHGDIALVSPLMQEGSLTEYLRKYRSSNRLQFCIELVDSLEYLHSAGVVHGDIKPGNVFMTDQGRPVLGDFGSALLRDNPSIAFSISTVVYTVRYAAPELLEGKLSECTTEADIYALGMTILYIITGKPPYPDKHDAVVIGQVTIARCPPPRPDFGNYLANTRAQDKVWDLLERCWAYNPGNRPTAALMREGFTDVERIIVIDHKSFLNTSI